MWCKRLERDAFGVATVVAKSREFHWVTVDRDATPQIPKRLNVSAYPSLLVLVRRLANLAEDGHGQVVSHDNCTGEVEQSAHDTHHVVRMHGFDAFCE